MAMAAGGRRGAGSFLRVKGEMRCVSTTVFAKREWVREAGAKEVL